MAPVVVGHSPARDLALVRFKYRDGATPPPPGPLQVPALIPSHSPLVSHATHLVQEPLYAPGTLARLLALVERAQRIDPSYVPPRFDYLRQVRTPSVAIARDLADTLRASPDVEFAYAVRVAPLPNVDPGSDVYSGQQKQLDPPPDGVNARAAWAAGADGSGVMLVDVEHAYHPHEDLPPTLEDVFVLDNSPALSEQGHGTAVLGIVAAMDNTGGGIGISPQTLLGFASRRPFNLTEDHLPDALAASLARLQYGDVLLLEVQDAYEDPADGHTYYTPIETLPDVRVNVEAAVAAGITVVEAAGDSDYEITAACGTDSGAIVVGAISSTTYARDPSMVKTGHGTRVDCCAWGDKVVTSGGIQSFMEGSAGTNDAYTNDFGGTSAAAAIVAGATCLLQSYVVKQRGYRLDPGTLRNLLRGAGAHTAGWDPNPALDTDQLGVIPNLGAAIQALQIPIPYYIRTEPDDDGRVPRPRPGDCPDIIAHRDLVPSGVDPFTRPESIGGLEDPHNFVYVRGLGDPFSRPVLAHAEVFCTRPSLIPAPWKWQRIGQMLVGEIVGDGKPHSRWAPLPWRFPQAIEWQGYSLIALLGDKGHRPPRPEGIRGKAEALRFYRQNRFVGVRTRLFGLQGAMSRNGAWLQAFRFGSGAASGNDGDGGEEYLFVEHELPWADRIWLELPTYATNVRERDDAITGRGYGMVELEGSTTRIRLQLHPGLEAECALYVKRHERYAHREGAIVVRRMAGDRELGMLRAIVRPITAP